MADETPSPSPTDPIIIPVIPDQIPGLSFEIKASGKIGLADSGPATTNDLHQIKDIREVLLEALDDALAQSQNSNAFAVVAALINKYKQALSTDPLSVDKLYAWGLRLENLNTKIVSQIKAGDLPDTDLPLAESLDTVLALHGTSVLLTSRGQELVAKGNAYRRTQQEQLAYREKALAFIEKLKAKSVPVEPEAVEALQAATQDMATGRHPERSSALAEAGNSNMLGLISKLAISTATATAMAIVGKGLAATVPGQIAADQVTQIGNVAWHFLLTHHAQLRGFAALGGEQLSYLHSVLNVVTRFKTAESYADHFSGDAKSEENDEGDEAAEAEARRLILAGQPVPDSIAKMVRELSISHLSVATLENLSNLINLKALYASNCMIKDLSPLSNLRSLRRLEVAYNEIQDLSPLVGLTALENLDVNGNQITDVSPIAGLTVLDFLDASNTRIADLSPIAGLTVLQVLQVNGSKVSNLEPIASLSNLRHLDIRHTEVLDLAVLANMPKLQTLFASYTHIRDLSPIAGLKSLRAIYVDGTEISNLSPLEGLTALDQIDASFTQVTDLSPLARLSNLKSIEVDFTKIAYLPALDKLTTLHTFGADGTQIADLSPLSELNELTTLRVPHTNIVDLSPLTRLAKLQRLHINDTQISNLSPLANLVNLQALYADNTKVKDISPLNGLISLRELHVGGTHITDLSPTKDLHILQILYAGHTQVRNLSPLSGLANLQVLDVNNTGIADIAPLAALKELRTVDISRTQVRSLKALELLPKLHYLGVAHMRHDLVPFDKWPASLEGICLVGTPWPALPPVTELRIVILPDGTLAGEKENRFVHMFSVHLTEEQKNKIWN